MFQMFYACRLFCLLFRSQEKASRSSRACRHCRLLSEINKWPSASYYSYFAECSEGTVCCCLLWVIRDHQQSLINSALRISTAQTSFWLAICYPITRHRIGFQTVSCIPYIDPTVSTGCSDFPLVYNRKPYGKDAYCIGSRILAVCIEDYTGRIHMQYPRKKQRNMKLCGGSMQDHQTNKEMMNLPCT